VVHKKLGSGQVYCYGYWAGLTYFSSSIRSSDTSLATGWSADARAVALRPVVSAGAARHVDASAPGVEGLLLECSAGAAVTLLNWFGTELQDFRVTLPDLGFMPKSARSIRSGPVRMRRSASLLEATILALKTVDVLIFEK
jgi:hypothetical protein